jgi:hypothetical protein
VKAEDGYRDLGAYRDYLLYAVEDGHAVRGYALHRDDETSESAFTIAGTSVEAVARRLRELVDQEAAGAQ